MFRKTFLFAINDLQNEQGKELKAWVESHQVAEIVRDNGLDLDTEHIAGDFDTVHDYEKKLYLDPGSEGPRNCYVVVLTGADWLNFTGLLMEFAILIRQLNIDVQHCYDYVLKDEHYDLSDIFPED